MTEPFTGGDDEARRNVDSHRWLMAQDLLAVCGDCAALSTDTAAIHPCSGLRKETTLKRYTEPRRVRLISTTDPHTDLKSGDLGWAVGEDSTGTVMVDWDCGSGLGLIPAVDRWAFV